MKKYKNEEGKLLFEERDYQVWEYYFGAFIITV